jgi:hypothetical protein
MLTCQADPYGDAESVWRGRSPYKAVRVKGLRGDSARASPGLQLKSSSLSSSSNHGFKSHGHGHGWTLLWLNRRRPGSLYSIVEYE